MLLHFRNVWRRCESGKLGNCVIDAVKSSSKGLLYCFECEGGGAEPNTFVHVLEHECELAFVVATARAAVSDVMADHRLKLERYVLDDVRSVGAVAKANDESSSLANAAAMFFKTGHR